MPSRKKMLMFAAAFFTSIWSFVIVCLVLATKHWASSKVTFSQENSSINTELFLSVLDKLDNVEAKSVNVVIIFLLVLSLFSSLLSSGFTCSNTVCNPYQTFLGPIGIYTWNSLNGIFIFLAMILFAVNIEANKLPAKLASKCTSSTNQSEKSTSNYGYSYWIMLLILLLNVATIVIIFFYHRARYSEKKEQERPIENAPKDGILF
uniref:Clarin 3 n=1 Tax=Crocodylus porosus TaxID=8502 RepID=A0A7M4ERQ3_CROPO